MKAAGFSLIEVLVATAIVVGGTSASLAQLFVLSADANRMCAAATLDHAAAGAAEDGELRADAGGTRPSPPGALSANTPGYFDYLDADGPARLRRWLRTACGAMFVRRWSIEPLAAEPGATVSFLRVVVR